MSRTDHRYRLGPLLDCEWTLSRCRDVRDMTFERPPRSESEKAQRARMKRLPSKRRRQDERIFLEDHMRYLLPSALHTSAPTPSAEEA